MRTCLILAAFGGWEFRAEKMVAGRTSYELCSEVSSGGNGKIYRAARSGKCSLGSDAIVKCGPVGYEGLYTTEWDNMSSLQNNPWAVKAFDFFYNEDAQPCIGMEELGIDFQKIRGVSTAVWSTNLIASIGIALVDALTQLHNVHNLVHTDLHMGNVATRILKGGSEHVSDHLVVFDYGDMKLAASDAKDSRNGLIRADMQQALISLRFLVDGNTNFYVAKRYTYNKEEVCSSGIDANLCKAIDYVYNTKPNDVVDHAYMRACLVDMLNGVPYQQRIMWDTNLIPAVNKAAANGPLKKVVGIVDKNKNNVEDTITTTKSVQSAVIPWVWPLVFIASNF